MIETIAVKINREIADMPYGSGKPGMIVAPDRYLPMPYDDFAALSRLTAPESASQFKAAVVSATDLLRFKQNSSYYPEHCPPSIQVGV